MPIHIIINQIIVLFLLMGLGYVLAKKKIFDQRISDRLTWLLCYIVMPCLILNAFQIPFSDTLWHNFIQMCWITFLIHVLYIVLSKILLNSKVIRKPEIVTPMQFTAVYSNCGFMGIPLVLALVGSSGVFYGSVYIAVNGLFVWTHGLLIYTGKFDRRSLLKVLINPNTLASIIGALFFIFSIRLPTPVHATLGYIASMNTALSMMVVGAAMSQIQLRKIWFDFYVWISVVMRNLIFPVAILAVLVLMEVKGTMLMTAIALTACPVAGMSVLFAQLTGRDTDFPCKSLTLSTLMSLFTLPLLLILAS